MFPDNYSEFENYEEHSMFMYDVTTIKHEPMTDSCSETSESPIYTDLSSVQYSPAKLAFLKQENSGVPDSFDTLLSWTSTHPEHWSNKEVLDWVFYVADAKQFDCSQFYGERYQSLTGQKMCRMSKADFTAMDSHYGAVLHDLFRSLVQKSKFSEPAPPDSMNPDGYPFLDTTFPCLPVPYSMMSPASSTQGEDLPLFVNDSGVTALIDGNEYDFDACAKIEIPTTDDLGYVSAGSEMDSSSNTARCSSTSSDPYDVFNMSDEEEMNTTPIPLFPQSSRTRPTPSNSSVGDVDDKSAPQRRRIPSTSKGNHLWEFIRDLLKDPSLNPSLLKWEDKEAGIFKFIQSEAVASMWGRKKNNPGMTYEKLSRAMRFCRSAGYFGDVPKNGKFPKKLCFRFGPKAHDWK